MQVLKPAAAGVVILVAFAGTAVADSDWQTIHAAGDPRIVMDIPAAASQVSSVDPKKGQLMFFLAANSDNDKTLECFLTRDHYSKKMNAKAWQASLQTKSASMLCGITSANISHYELDTSASTTSNGYSAATCDAAYADDRQKLQGVVMSVLTVAAPDALYSLTCKTGAVDRDEAIASWLSDWKDMVAHMQSSLRLPSADK